MLVFPSMATTLSPFLHFVGPHYFRGEVTYHCPGQIVGYPILNLNAYKKDLHWYVRQIEEVLICTLAAYGLEGKRHEEHTGVWVGSAKVRGLDS